MVKVVFPNHPFCLEECVRFQPQPFTLLSLGWYMSPSFSPFHQRKNEFGPRYVNNQLFSQRDANVTQRRQESRDRSDVTFRETEHAENAPHIRQGVQERSGRIGRADRQGRPLGRLQPAEDWKE